MSGSAPVAEIFRQVAPTPDPIFCQAVERPSRSVIQHRFVQTVKANADAEGQRTFHLPAALLAKFLRRLFLIMSHAAATLSALPARIKPHSHSIQNEALPCP
jgi:hypothetical protein